MYKITPYTKRQAKRIHVRVRPSTLKHKKIDVFSSQGKKLGSVGYRGMMDYPSYIQSKGIRYAKTRRKIYYQRHSNDGHKKGSNGWLAKKLLW